MRPVLRAPASVVAQDRSRAGHRDLTRLIAPITTLGPDLARLVGALAVSETGRGYLAEGLRSRVASRALSGWSGAETRPSQGPSGSGAGPSSGPPAILLDW